MSLLDFVQLYMLHVIIVIQLSLFFVAQTFELLALFFRTIARFRLDSDAHVGSFNKEGNIPLFCAVEKFLNTCAKVKTKVNESFYPTFDYLLVCCYLSMMLI